MNRRVIGLIASVALAAIGTIVLVSYVRSAEARALDDEQLTSVLVVTDPIESGTKAKDITGAVRSVDVPKKVRALGAVDDLATLTGLVADVDLLPGEQVVRDRFVEPSVAQRGDVPPGMHEVTLSLDVERALGGRLVPNETVGVVASFTDAQGAASSHLILHKALVTSMQLDVNASDEIDEDEEDSVFANNKVLVTLALSPEDVERLVFAAEHGHVWLSSEPADAPVSGTGVQTYQSVMR
jgi:pilus assembly protein CpaB